MIDIKSFKSMVGTTLVEKHSKRMNVGLFPGAFKPPHVGHYNTAVMGAKRNDKMLVIVSNNTRGAGSESIDGNTSYDIWMMYKEFLLKSLPEVGKKIHIILVPGAEVITAVYNTARLLNQSWEGTTDASKTAHKLVDAIGDADRYALKLYACSEDISQRYGSFFKPDTKDMYQGNKVVISSAPCARAASASELRPLIGSFRHYTSPDELRSAVMNTATVNNDYSTLLKNLPGDDELKDRVINLLIKK